MSAPTVAWYAKGVGGFYLSAESIPAHIKATGVVELIDRADMQPAPATEQASDEDDEMEYPPGYSPSIMDADGLPQVMRLVIQSKGSYGALTSLYNFIDKWAEAQRKYAATQAERVQSSESIDATDQAGFEAWARSHGDLLLDRANDEACVDGWLLFATYKFQRTEIAWRAWANALARRATASKAEAPDESCMPPFAAPASQLLIDRQRLADIVTDLLMDGARAKSVSFRDGVSFGVIGLHHKVLELAGVQPSIAGAAKGGIDDPNGAVQAGALPVAAAPEQKP